MLMVFSNTPSWLSGGCGTCRGWYFYSWFPSMMGFWYIYLFWIIPCLGQPCFSEFCAYYSLCCPFNVVSYLCWILCEFYFYIHTTGVLTIVATVFDQMRIFIGYSPSVDKIQWWASYFDVAVVKYWLELTLMVHVMFLIIPVYIIFSELLWGVFIPH